MRTANVKHARENLRQLIDEAAAGEEIILLRRGDPVARLVPVESQAAPLPNLADFRSSIRVRGRPLSEEIIAAREDERY